jgi:phosphoglycolate phosphatase-like HAD superfamily hydrolase
MTQADQSPVTVVIFDIDGTLIDSTPTHHASLTHVLLGLGLDPFSKPWTQYRHYTDSGVLDELWHDRRGHSATEEELAALDTLTRQTYGEITLGTPVAEIAGAKALLEAIARQSDMQAVFATGSMRGTAPLKLTSLGLDVTSEIVSTGSDHLSRADIVKRAVSACYRREGRPFRLVALGDGRWDEITARALGIPFIGIQTGMHVFDAVQHTVCDTLLPVTTQMLQVLSRPPDPSQFSL